MRDDMDIRAFTKTDKAGMVFTMQSGDIDALIGGNLRRLRELRKLSQTQLAEMTGTPQTRISAIEYGKEGMGKDIMTRICRALEVQPWEFYITEKTPIITDEKERETLYALREAERLHVAEDIARYGRFRIEEAKKTGAASGKDAGRRSQRTRKKKV